MDNFIAFAIGEANRGRKLMVFDWDLAAKIIKERLPESASAGLSGDWEYTGGEIYRDGKPVPKDETYTYLASTWATPELEIDGEVIPCFKMQSETPNWGSGTYWPEEALKVLEAL